MGRSSRLLCGAAAVALLSAAGGARAEEAAVRFEIPAQPLTSALNEFGIQSGSAVLFKADLAGAKLSRPLSGQADPEAALTAMLDGTGLGYRREGDAFVIVQGGSGDPQGGSAAGDGAGTVEALIVTAQKREEDIQDVPIAISAFSQEQLENSQVAGGPDLMTQIPNFTFTKTNFTGFSIQIRGIGTQAISATTDPAVAIAFNNTPFVRNRFFEQEFYDLQRVEVLRGPQGTLYGRNATAGVVNIISAKPSFNYEAKLSGDVANYNSTRLEGMINLPLVEDIAAMRLAAAWTKRDGYATNQITGNPIDGRDLWSTRLSLRFAPTDRLDVNLIWEHFEEDDDRIRSGKQLCKTHEVTEVAGFQTNHFQTLPEPGREDLLSGVQASFSQGCIAASLYSPEAFQTPNGLAVPYYYPLSGIGVPSYLADPYVSRTQSPDLRVIESTVDPEYRARTDIFEAQLALDLTDVLTLTSETAWSTDFIFSTQDFNRFATVTQAWQTHLSPTNPTDTFLEGIIDENGVFCDPQIGCSDRLVAVDLSTARSRHFSQELRLGSNFDGPFNFSLGGNFLRYDTEDKYYVFINSLTMAAANPFLVADALPWDPGVSDNAGCLAQGPIPPDPSKPQFVTACSFIDPNPIGHLNDLGHNYFLSRNPYKLISYAVFGEAYYNIADDLKVTAGLRWTVDKKEAPRIPSWLLAGNSAGYPVLEVVEQEWREPTGRLTIDWKPDLSFTDETLLYASYAHGYKAGGMNPPPYGVTSWLGNDVQNLLISESATNPKTFEAEFVDAFELGAKNTLLDGTVTLNAAAFYYDYKGYQISQIVDRSAVNLNFDAEVWGLELETDWRPLENLRLGLKLGYENTSVADGEQAIDLMDRTAGVPGWVVYRPFPSVPSNCILPEWLFIGNIASKPANPELVNVGGKGGGNPGGCELAYIIGNDPVTWDPYVANPPASTLPHTHADIINYTAFSTNPADFPGWPAGEPITDRPYPGWNPSTAPNNGEGFFKDLSGNELPNAPHYTATITADYTVPLPSDWLMTLHTDLYYQSEAWTRIFNTEGYDKLKAYTNVNLAAIFTNDEAGWKVMAYVKNVFDRDSITGAFLFSDDTMLTTNVFLTEPRLYGLRVTKEWNGGPWWTGANPGHTGPYPLTVELSGQIQRHDAPYETMTPSFVDAIPSTLDPLPVQGRDLDWGDGREVKLTWRPDSRWSVSGAFRQVRANGAHRLVFNELGDTACLTGLYGGVCPSILIETDNYSSTFVYDKEDHQIVEFVVGREVGLGVTDRSVVQAGVRYAQLEFNKEVEIGTGTWDLPPQAVVVLSAHNDRYQSSFLADGEFEGAGPVITWGASKTLLGGAETGHLDLDWSVGGGVLFGKQRTEISSEEREAHFTGKYSNFDTVSFTPWTPVEDIERSERVTVPVADISLGLAYEIQRVRIGAGYRWERYFDVLDGGFEEKKDVDRTIDGPYFKLSVGFGG